MINNLKVGLKLTLAFGLLLIALISAVAYSINKMDTLKSEFEQVMGDEFPKTVYANNAIDAVNAIARANRTALLAKDDKTIKGEIDKIQVGMQAMQTNLNHLTNSQDTSGEAEISKIAQQQAAYTISQSRYMQLLDDYVKAKANSDPKTDSRKEAAIDFLMNDVRTAQHAYTAALDEAISFFENNIHQSNTDIATLYDLTRNILIEVLAAVVVATLFIAFFITRSITQPLSQALKAFSNISQGHFDTPIDIKGTDELGNVLLGLKNMQQKLGTDAAETTRASKELATVLGGMATGELNHRVTGDYKAPFDNIKRDVNRVNETLSHLIAEMNSMSSQHDAGDIDVVIDTAQYQGAYQQMAKGVNGMVGEHIAAKKKAMACVKAFGEGNFDAPLDRFPGKKAFINDTIEQVRKNMQDVIKDSNMLAQAAAEGRVSVRADASKHQGDFRRIVEGINATLQTIVDPILIVKGATDSINTAAKEIAAGSADLSHRTEEQASSLEETAASMEELAATVKQNAENAKQANQLTANASQVAIKGGEVVKQVVHTMNSINESSRKIADIISVMDGISFQTNILALNAAVEAARAGDQGRGFAVVASEVRILAQHSASAAKEIKQLISESVKEISEGTRQVNHAGQTMDEIVNSVQHVTDIMKDIATASVEQSLGIDQINLAVTKMEEVTHQNAALVEETAAAAESLETQARSLSQAVAQFRLDDSQIPASPQILPTPKLSNKAFSFSDAINAHAHWKVRLIDYIKGKSDEKLDVATVSRDDKCDMGCWLHGPAKIHSNLNEYKQLVSTHADFHKSVGKIVQASQQGHTDEAMKMLGGEFFHQSNQTTKAIKQLQNRVEGSGESQALSIKPAHISEISSRNDLSQAEWEEF